MDDKGRAAELEDGGRRGGRVESERVDGEHAAPTSVHQRRGMARASMAARDGSTGSGQERRWPHLEPGVVAGKGRHRAGECSV